MMYVLPILENSQREFLVTQRAFNKKWAAGNWEMPGGGAKSKESSLDAIKREVKEETGLDVEVVRVLGLSTHITDKNAWGDAQENIAIGFEVQLVGGRIQADGDETLEVKWLPVSPEPQMFVPQAQRTMHKILTENEGSDKAWFRENGE